jgi:hypothetical protein
MPKCQRRNAALILAVAQPLAQGRTETRHCYPISAFNLSAPTVMVESYHIRPHRWQCEKNLLVAANDELSFLPRFGLTANIWAVTSLSMTHVFCSQCGTMYQRTETQLPVRDRNDFRCSCGEVLEFWNSSRVPVFRLAKPADKKG